MWFSLLELLHMDLTNSFSCNEVVAGIPKEWGRGKRLIVSYHQGLQNSCTIYFPFEMLYIVDK